MKKEKDFEVLISPTDVLAQELEDVLGGSGTGCWIDVSCDARSEGCNIDLSGLTDADCPDGMHAVNGHCVEID